MEPGRTHPDDPDDPVVVTVGQLADLQAGLLDDEAAARLRERIRADPAAQRTLRALDRTRTAVAGLGADPGSAPEVPPELTPRIDAALRDAMLVHTVTGSAPARTAVHARYARSHTARTVAAACGVAAVVAGVGVGTAALLRSPGVTTSTLTTANRITVTARVPLSARELGALVARSPEFGALADPKRRASCLSGLGYPGSQQVLGAQPLTVDGRPAVVLVLPGEHPGELVALAVAPNCSSVDTGLIADTTVRRP